MQFHRTSLLQGRLQGRRRRGEVGVGALRRDRRVGRQDHRIPQATDRG